MEALLGFDRQLFLRINGLPHNSVFDSLALFFSGIGNSGMVWFMLCLILFLREKKKHHMFFAPIVAAGAISWLLVERIVKPLVQRVRPTLELGAILVGNTADGFSFPSGHATIAFAMAAVLSAIEPRWKAGWIGLAATISFSRVYLGVHFPLDVLAGALLGWTVGVMTNRAAAIIRKQ